MITEEEKSYIRTSYRDAKDKGYQIIIEAQLHATSKDRICEILGIELKTRDKEDQKRKLYDMGWDDERIASYLMLSPHTICDWRHKRGLPQAGKTVVYADIPKRDLILFECYSKGMSSYKSASFAGCSRTAANEWRKRNKLPCVSRKHPKE